MPLNQLKSLTVQASVLLAVVAVCVTVLLVTDTIDLRTASEIGGFVVALATGAKYGAQNEKTKDK